MDEQRFDRLIRVLAEGATRRGVVAAGAGLLGLQLTEMVAARRKRAKHRSAKRRTGRQVGAEQLVTIREGCPENPPESLPLYLWWDHTDLTVAVQAGRNVDAAYLEAVHEAIAIWDDVLRRAFGGLITLTDITGTTKAAHKADIVLHYVPNAGGVVFGGRAVCRSHGCNNVIVTSDPPDPLDLDHIYTPEYVGWVTLHELGHALGLHHALPLEETNDLMGYGWADPAFEPVLSPCDLRALEAVFAWAFEGVDPHPPTVSSVSCSGLCGV